MAHRSDAGPSGPQSHLVLPSAPGPEMMSLPNEVLFFIAGHLSVSDLLALSLVNRRLNGVAAPVLWNILYSDELMRMQVLLWAVEGQRHDIIEILLRHDTKLNFLYLSPILRSRMQDLLAAQGRGPGAEPLEDEEFDKEIFREIFCRNGHGRRRLLYRQANTRANAPNVAIGHEQSHWRRMASLVGSLLHTERFGVLQVARATDCRYWSWAPIHVAILRGDIATLRLLLDHGADVNAQCSGACDCAVPRLLTGEDDPNASVFPQQQRSVWTPLHVAICTGNEEAARLLISRGASFVVGAVVDRPIGLLPVRLWMTALQNAAWIGSVRMCEVLLDNPRYKALINRADRRGHTALHYAAAGGHIRTVGKFLLESGARFNFYHEPSPEAEATATNPRSPDWGTIKNDPLRLLCMQYRYEDARWLIDFCRRLYRNQPFNPKPLYSRALAVLCSLQAPAVHSQRSLRQQQAQLLKLTWQDMKREVRQEETTKEIKASQRRRLSLATKLLNLGADPNQPQPTLGNSVPFVAPASQDGANSSKTYRTPLQLAATSGFAKMAELLLSRGADWNKTGIRDERATLWTLPLLQAVDHALKFAPSEPELDGYLRTVEAFLDAGIPLDDIAENSLTTMLYNRKCSNGVASLETWFRLMEMFLDHGAAKTTSQQNWETLVRRACVPGNLRVCQLLEAARPIRGCIPEQDLTVRLAEALRGSREPGPRKVLQNPAWAKWLIRQMANEEVVKDTVLSYAYRFRVDGIHDDAITLENFHKEMWG